MYPFDKTEYPREYDAAGKNPLRDLERNDRFDLTGPAVECKEIHGSESIDTIHGTSREGQYP